MAVRDFFSKRRAREARGGEPDVYRYDSLPPHFRVQVVHIWKRALGERFWPLDQVRNPPLSVWEMIEADVAEEHGVFQLGSERDAYARVANYFLKIDPPLALDVIEAVFGAVETHVRDDWSHARAFIQQHPDSAIEDLNLRFREHSIGYEYTNGHVVRVDSQYVHAEVVRPVLTLLDDPEFAGAEDEFLAAHSHYRGGNYKEAINEALKAFESTLKSICQARGWSYDKERDTAKALLEIVLREQLVPNYLQNAFGGLRSVLEGTVPTARNRTSGHGQGPETRTVPEYFAAYVLHMTASNILLLMKAHTETP